MNDIQIFNNPQFGQVRIKADDVNNPMFCLSDLCLALGIVNSRNVRARLEEEDVRLMDTLTNGGIQQIAYVTESGMYDVILRSDSENARPFRRWLTKEVLPSIRKTGSYSSPSVYNPLLQAAQTQLLLIREISADLRLNEASKLGMYQHLAEQHNLIIPSYVASKGVMKSAKDLLKGIGSDLSAIKFNKLLADNGYLELKSRPSSKGKPKNFWSITEKGSVYGENCVSPKNQNETQPRWYEDKFQELFNLVKL